MNLGTRSMAEGGLRSGKQTFRMPLVAVVVGCICACLHASHFGQEPDDGGSSPFSPPCDAGQLPDGGQWSLAAFADCSCRCPNGIAIATTSATCSSCYACSCDLGTVDLAAGCVANDDCVLAPADCCGCENGGSSTAILGGNLSWWTSSMSLVCGGVPPFLPDGGTCPTRQLCGGAKSRCDPDAGRCTLSL